MTTLSDELIQYIQTQMSPKDIIHLHILVNGIYDEIKENTKNFAAFKWATLHPQQNRDNNKVQQRKYRANKKLPENTTQHV